VDFDPVYLYIYTLGKQFVWFVFFVCEGEILITVCHLVMFMVPLESSLLRGEVHPWTLFREIVHQQSNEKQKRDEKHWLH